MKFQVKVEYGREKFVKFFDGKVLRYSFSSLAEDIRRTCGSLQHRTSSTSVCGYSTRTKMAILSTSTRTTQIVFKRCLFVPVQ